VLSRKISQFSSWIAVRSGRQKFSRIRLQTILNIPRSQSRFVYHLLFSLLGTLFFWLATATPSYSHWADLAVAEILVNQGSAQVTLTFPTGLVAFADNNGDGSLLPAEVRTHEAQLQSFLSDRIRMTNDIGLKGSLAVKPLELAGTPSGLNLQPSTHSTLVLDYTWPKPVSELRINYNLFLPGVSTASCQATILYADQVTSFVFTPKNREFSVGGTFRLWGWSWLLAIAGSIIWGAMHALSPGHGKTIVGAYLVGSRATPQHALLLALTTTITHTLGVFALGAGTFFASKWISPEGLYPWLSLISGLLVVAIGLNLSSNRLREILPQRKPTVDLLSRGTWEREYSTVSAGHSHSHGHHHSHSHGHHHHHLPPGVDGPVTWQSLVALGISGGLLPCPSALVMLLSATAVGQAGLGLTLVLAFSLGLAGVLSAIGLTLVYARRIFEKMDIFKQSQETMGIVRVLPAVSALCVMLLGLGLTGQALVTILDVRF
jgi:nickel/cobalt exporter